MNYTRHIAGELIQGVQRCVVCGFILSDYRNTLTSTPHIPLKGWSEGAVYVKGNITQIAQPEFYQDCK